jgi:hypothetical protein
VIVVLMLMLCMTAPLYAVGVNRDEPTLPDRIIRFIQQHFPIFRAHPLDDFPLPTHP